MHTEEHKKRISEGVKNNLPKTAYKKGDNAGEKSHKWLGEDAGYFSKHAWVARNFEKPETCEHCRQKKDYYEWANLSGKYVREREDWKYVCVPCHREIDGQTRKVHQYDIQGKFIKTHRSLASLREIGFDAANISKCCLGGRRQKTSKGFFWRYDDSKDITVLVEEHKTIPTK